MNKKVLICDDDEGILEVISIILTGNGFEVNKLTNGRGIVKKIIDYQPDLILLDIWMPGIQGEEITKLLKREPQTKNIPIIVVSALAETERICQRIGADGFIAKPFDLNYFLTVVKQYTA